MKVFRLDPGPGVMPAVERLLADSRKRRREPMEARERISESLVGAGLVAAVVAMSAGFDVGRDLELGPALALVIAFAIAARVQFDVGPGYTAPTQVVLVPMLFVLPTPYVPLFVAAGMALAKLIDIVAGDDHPDRMVLSLGDAWYAVGPALVLCAFDASTPDWGDAPIYMLAFVAQVALDAGMSTLRNWLALGVAPPLNLSSLAGVWTVDALLSPLGLVAAFVAQGAPYRALLVLPVVALIAVFSQEREAHIVNALELSNAYRGTALLLGDVLEDKDAYTASHSHGVVELSLQVADSLGLDAGARRRVEFGALLHDIGKIAVPSEIINKPGPLDDDEWAVMKLHTVEGQTMLDRVGGVLGDVGRVVRSSHEHWDGSGYPDGLAGEAIPVEARIVSCCDAFSAMTTDRSYRAAMTDAEAIHELVAHSGTQFDPQVVDALLTMLHGRGTRATARTKANRAGDADAVAPLNIPEG